MKGYYDIDEEGFYREVEPLGDLNILFENSDAEFDERYVTEAKRDTILYRIDTNPEFAHAWVTNYSLVFYNDILTRCKHESAFSVKLIGDPGSGKSFASLYIFAYLMHKYLDYKYEILWSRAEAQYRLAYEQYKLSKTQQSFLSRVNLIVDEDRKRFGSGSMQEDVFFQQIIDFLRVSQINLIITSPFNSSPFTTEIMLEAMGYTKPNEKGETYEKLIVYYLVDKDQKTYAPRGYILTKMPPKELVDLYLRQKYEFQREFKLNKSPAVSKNNQLLEFIYNEMSEDDKNILRKFIILGRERYVSALLKKYFTAFNFPTNYQKELMDSFLLTYFKKELDEQMRRQSLKMEKVKEKVSL